MSKELAGQLIRKLQESQNELTAVLQSVADHQDWQPDPDQWSFRYVAAHLATTEDECFLERLKRFSTEENPHFEHYDNTGRDFSSFGLVDSLRKRAALRQELLDMVRTMPETIWSRTATHSTRGTQTPVELLQVILEHDQEHLGDLERAVSKFTES